VANYVDCNEGLKGVQVDSSGSIEGVYKLASVVINDVFAGKYGQKDK
jgi:hypothetical protein